MRVESGDIRYPHFSGDNQTDCTRPFFENSLGPRLIIAFPHVHEMGRLTPDYSGTQAAGGVAGVCKCISRNVKHSHSLSR